MGGFSPAAPRQLPGPVVSGGFAPEYVNVADQRRDPDSLWSFFRTLIQAYRERPELGWGDFMVLPQPLREVLVHRCAWEGSAVVAVHNAVLPPIGCDSGRGRAAARSTDLDHRGSSFDSGLILILILPLVGAQRDLPERWSVNPRAAPSS